MLQYTIYYLQSRNLRSVRTNQDNVELSVLDKNNTRSPGSSLMVYS